MKPLFRKYFWLLTGAFVLVAVVIAARTVHLVTGFQLAVPIPSLDSKVAAHATHQPHEANVTLRTAVLSRLLGVSESEPSPMPRAESLRRSGRRARLIGTLTSRQPFWSLASVQDLDTERVRSIRVGDALQDAEVVIIERERIIVSVNGLEEVIDRHGPSGASTPTRTATPVATDAPPTIDVRRVSEHAYEVASKDLDIDRWTMNPQMMQVRIVPAFQDGKPQGFKLFSIRQGSVYEQLGLQNGDIIQRINGISLDSPQRALESYALLKQTRHLEVDIRRDGAALRKVYDVK